MSLAGGKFHLQNGSRLLDFQPPHATLLRPLEHFDAFFLDASSDREKNFDGAMYHYSNIYCSCSKRPVRTLSYIYRLVGKACSSHGPAIPYFHMSFSASEAAGVESLYNSRRGLRDYRQLSKLTRRHLDNVGTLDDLGEGS